MKTFDWSTTVQRDSLLFNAFGTEIRDTLAETGATFEWARELYSGPDGEWRLPSLDEYGDRIYSISSKGRNLNGDLHANFSSPHGWGTALDGGQWVNEGDDVRVKLTAFDSGRHLLEGWLTRETIDSGTLVAYYALAHLGKDQDVLGVDFTHDQLHTLLADPTATPPARETNQRDALRDDLHELALEFRRRQDEIFARHGVDPRDRPHRFGPPARGQAMRRPAGV